MLVPNMPFLEIKRAPGVQIMQIETVDKFNVFIINTTLDTEVSSPLIS